jgi:hypothetical protein
VCEGPLAANNYGEIAGREALHTIAHVTADRLAGFLCFMSEVHYLVACHGTAPPAHLRVEDIHQAYTDARACEKCDCPSHDLPPFS